MRLARLFRPAGRSEAPRGPRPRVRDADMAAAALDAQERLGSRWLVMYSPWHRKLTAFAMIPGRARVVDADTVRELFRLTCAAESSPVDATRPDVAVVR